MSKQNEGSGISKTPLPSEDQDKIRRANKAKRQHTGSGKTASRSETLFEGIKADRQELREQRQQEVRTERLRKQTEFRRRQAAKATEHPSFLALQSGTPAANYALAIVEIFPDLTPPSDKSISRTAMAVAVACTKLSAEDLNRPKALEKGRSVACTALRWAYVQLQLSEEKTEKETSPVTPSIIPRQHLELASSASR